MASKSFLLLGLFAAIVLLIASEAAARDLENTKETTLTNVEDASKEKASTNVEDAKYGGYPGSGYNGGGGYPGGGGGRGYGGRGGCRYGCCYRSYNGCRRCCNYAGQAVETQVENKP